MDIAHFLDGQDPHKTAIVPAVESTLEIRDDLNDRGGLEIDGLDDEVQEDILQTWVKIIEPKARKFGRETALQALGLFWAEKFPNEILPSTELVAVVDRILPPS